MKLSEKGYLKIGNSIVGWFENGVAKVTFDPDKIEFKPDDFKDCVVLTVNQAKELALKLKNNAEFFFLQTGEFDYDTDDLWQCLTEKIEQAEMSIVSTQCENVSKKDEKIITLSVEQAEDKE